MQRIRIISVGKMKEKYYLQAQEEYLKRLGRFARVEVVELKDYPTPEEPSPREQEVILQKEGEAILKTLKEREQVFALCVEGKQVDSPGFSRMIGEAAAKGSDLAIVIGGSMGLHPSVKQRADARISFGAITLPHRLCRVVLLEQLFRGYKILSGESYHK